jgi:hypothetical protein
VVSQGSCAVAGRSWPQHATPQAAAHVVQDFARAVGASYLDTAATAASERLGYGRFANHRLIGSYICTTFINITTEALDRQLSPTLHQSTPHSLAMCSCCLLTLASNSKKSSQAG